MSNISIKKITIFVLSFVISAPLFSQKNQPYKEGYTYFFLRDSMYDGGVMKSSYSSLIPISVTKTEVNSSGNFSYIFNKTVNERFESSNVNCHKKTTASNISSSINYMSNGQFYIISHFNDTIYFKIKDSVGSTWNLFGKNSQDPKTGLNTRIKSITIDTVLGELDTIITYQYLPYDIWGILDKKHPIYLKESKFALNHGFTETIDLRGFPNVFQN